MIQETRWLLSQTDGERFPYIITIVKRDQVLLSLLAQDKWPGTKGNIFCYRSEEANLPEPDSILEEVGVLTYDQFGKRLNLVLDRPQKKRCSFLFLTKQYKNKPGEYEQIFWQTQMGLTQRGAGYKLSYYNNQSFDIIVDPAERYAWNFPGLRTKVEKIPIGDYAIKDQHGLLAVVERKTFANLLHEFGNLKKFHQQLYELQGYRYSAVVLEATYADFLNADKLKYYQPAFAKKALAEIQTIHPSLPLIYAGGRKYAIEWTRSFFTSIKGTTQQSQQLPDRVAESVATYGVSRNLNGGIETEVTRFILDNAGQQVSIQTLRDNFPTLTDTSIRRVLAKLRANNQIRLEGRGKQAKWEKEVELKY